MKPLISIIIPVYGVEKYLERCVDSVLNQTYSNIEVLLVDDGSLDNCPKICDNYAEIDSRIKVIHKENGGLSSARNCGLKIANGDYIGFVDSDDYIEPEMFEKLMFVLLKTNSDISICGVKDEYEDVKPGIPSDVNYVTKQTVINGSQALQYVLKDTVIVSHAWDKLYKAELWNNIEFPEGKRFEDMYTLYKVISRTKQVVLIPEKQYVYIHHSDSISYNKMQQNCFDIFGAYKEWLSFAKNNCTEIVTDVLNKAVTMGIDTYNVELKTSEKVIDTNDIFQFLKQYEKQIMNTKEIRSKYKLFCFTILHLTGLHKIMYLSVFHLRKMARKFRR